MLIFAGVQSLSSALASTMELMQFTVNFTEHQHVRCSRQEFSDGNAEQPQSWCPSVPRKILHNRCRACAWSNKNLFRTIRKNVISATENWCFSSARSWALEWETEVLGSSEDPSWVSAKICLFKQKSEFHTSSSELPVQPS